MHNQAFTPPRRNSVHLSLIRHGETSWNASKRLQGWQNIDLNETGRQQARALLAYWQTAWPKPDRIVSSDLSRADETARLLFPGEAIESTASWRERRYGVVEGMGLAEINRCYPDLAAALQRRDTLFAPTGGETLTDFARRIGHSLDKLLAESTPGQHIALVSHGGVLDIIRRHVMKLPLTTPRDVEISNTGVSRLSINDGQLSIDFWNALPHLNLACDELATT